MTELELKELQGEVKGYLKITWTDEDSDILGYVKEGIEYLDEIAGVKINYTTDLKAKQLLKDYCRYVYNHSLEMFEVNFKRELLKLSIREGVKAHVTANAETTS